MPTAQSNGIEVYYEEQGSGDPLLLIMGLAGDSIAWMFQREAFAARYRTIVFDNRGVGRTSKPAGPYTIAQMAADAVGVLDALDIADAHVVGVSMGGMIAQELALRHPQRVRGLVLGCTYARPDSGVTATFDESLAFFGGTKGPNGEIQVDLSNLDPMAFIGRLLPLTFSPQFIMTELPKLMQVFSGVMQHGFDLGAIMAQVAATQAHDTVDRLEQINAPTLVLTGDSDQLIPPSNSDVIAARIPGAQLKKLPGGSHGFNFETPEAFNAAVLEFLDSCRS
ncbi:MAG TPA: alpha/beta fold hydrolase [Candidatus Dormibacteraeota bacterium]|nr:alpha/beta fold hydrolase [Candidatus Dormibacteraeota bacterium]